MFCFSLDAKKNSVVDRLERLFPGGGWLVLICFDFSIDWLGGRVSKMNGEQ
jgi:hypothetical protein